MNNSLSDLLDGMDDGFADSQPFCNEGATVMTKDSVGRDSLATKDSIKSPMRKKAGTLKKTKRGHKKKDAKADQQLEEPSSEHLLSGLLSSPQKSKKKMNDDCMTVSTMDSVHREKHSSKPKSKRGGKKKSSSNNDSGSNLEAGLSDLLCDDDDDAPSTSHKRVPRECGTVSTLDSVERHKQQGSGGSGNSSKATSRSKRGGRRSSGNGNSLSLNGGPPPAHPPSLSGALDKLGGRPKDFGRQADDADTFCGLGTVGESELAKAPLHKSPKSSKSPRKAKIAVPSPRSRASSNAAAAAPKPFMNMNNDDDDDSEEEEDLFEGFGANPFRMPTYL